MLRIVLISLALAPLLLCGCVQRTVSITSEPPGALVWVNDREVGRTPLEFEFVHYGEYDVRLERAGYEPLLTTGLAQAPLWDAPGPDLLAEMTPGTHRVELHWHYDMQPLEQDREALIERAREFGERVGE